MIHAYPWLLTTVRTHIHGYATVTAAPAFKSAGLNFLCKSFQPCRDYWWCSAQVYPRKGWKRSCQRGLVLYTNREENRGWLDLVMGRWFWWSHIYRIFNYEKENSGIENPAKCLKTEASNTVVKKPLGPANRFEGVTTSDQLATFSEGFVPANTEANTEWAVRNFDAWADWRIAQNPDDPVPSDILSCGDAVALSKRLSLYVIETWKQDGGRYPGSTLNLLLWFS